MPLIYALFILGFVLITKGADLFINCAVDIGKKANISEIVLGATIVSFATTLPEFTVSLLSSINGYTTMSLGNAIGSIICNTGLALGLVAIISPFKIDKNMFISKTTMLLASIIVLFILSTDKNISKFDGFTLISMLCIYMYTNYASVKRDNSTSLNKKKTKTSFKEWLKLIILFMIGIIMMVIGSRLLVDNGVIIAESLGVPKGIVSLTVIALGTSLPEIVSSLTAIKKNHHAISVGNVLGANILNILSVLGASSIANDIPILSQSMTIDFPIVIILLLVLILPTLRNNRLNRYQGFLLLGVYSLYLGMLYFIYI